ncbi:MAG: hypothetical protein ACI8Z9_000760, partial [Paraglaciecola sp.]
NWHFPVCHVRCKIIRPSKRNVHIGKGLYKQRPLKKALK